MVIIVMMFIVLGIVLAAGLSKVELDVPQVKIPSIIPGSGGMRRAFPAMNERKQNQTTQQKVELGKLLYFDPILSGDNTQSCATCHHPDLGLSDGRGISMGKGGTGVGPERTGGAKLKRGAPTIWNAAYSQTLFWDGRAKDFEEQARSPITASDEMNQNPDELIKEIKAVPEYVKLFDTAFNGDLGSSVTFENITNAIASFERTIITSNSPFDRYLAGDKNAMSAEQRRGITLFRSLKTRCFECHTFPTFSSHDFKVIGVPSVEGQKPDTGRHQITGNELDKNAFKVPTLRNIARTAPYMHNGRFASLDEVLTFYSVGGGHGFSNPLPNIDDKIRRFILSPQEKGDLIAFLNALTDESNKPAIPGAVPSGLQVVSNFSAVSKQQSLELNSKSPSKTIVRRKKKNIGAKSKAAKLKAAKKKIRPETGTQITSTMRNPMIIRVKSTESIQAALDKAISGDLIEIEPGTYRESLLIDTDNLTIRGLSYNENPVILDGGGTLTDAIITSSSDITFESLVIKDYVSNGITVHGGRNAAFRNLQIYNTGLYGIYPVECQGIIIESCMVSGVKDAGIYVGQSSEIIVRNNEVHNNVTGIEIENSINAIVENNYAHDNTGGILVFLLPNNPSKFAINTKVIRNRVINNNHRNFGDPNSTVGKVEPGSGILVMAADNTELTENEIRGNDSFGIAVVGLKTIFPNTKTFDVGVIPENTRITSNTFADNGRSPGKFVKEFGATNTDIVWDGSGWNNSLKQPNAKTFPFIIPGDYWPVVFKRSYSRIMTYLRG